MAHVSIDVALAYKGYSTHRWRCMPMDSLALWLAGSSAGQEQEQVICLVKHRKLDGWLHARACLAGGQAYGLKIWPGLTSKMTGCSCSPA